MEWQDLPQASKAKPRGALPPGCGRSRLLAMARQVYGIKRWSLELSKAAHPKTRGGVALPPGLRTTSARVNAGF